MTRGAPMRAGTGALLIGLLGLGVSGLVLLASAARTPRADVRGSVSASPGARHLALADSLAGREPVATTAAAENVLAAREDQRPDRRGAVRVARKEREFLAGFLALERAQPGGLESRAEEILAGTGPAAEKVALLRALGESGSAEHVRWLEHALGLPDQGAGPHGGSLPGYALRALAGRAREDAGARAALWRAAFERPGLAAELRRGAALALARSVEPGERRELEAALGREDDELLVAGALAALRDRDARAPEPAEVRGSPSR